MKKLSLFITFAMLAALAMVSCNNKPKEPTQEEVQEMKQALADSVLAEIDAIADEFTIASENGFRINDVELTEKEKQVKPDYLLDPAEANKLVTKYQKVNALAIYIQELEVREIYGMSTEETKATIVKLAAEVNFPFDRDQHDSKAPLSEIIKTQYENCKENGDLASFWQFQYAIGAELNYQIALNPELFFSRISEGQWNNFKRKMGTSIYAIRELAKYDEDMATLLEFCDTNRISKSEEEWSKASASVESAKQFYMANKDKYIARRNALLQ